MPPGSALHGRWLRLLLIVGSVAAIVAGLVVVRALAARPPVGPSLASAGADRVGTALVVEQTPAERERTLASLRRVDDHPLFQMTYYGRSPRVGSAKAGEPAGSPPARPVPGNREAPAAGYACTLFVAAGDPAHPVVGRNFDWDHHPALVLLADPPDGYASVSTVDLSYLGYDLDDVSALSEQGDPGRRNALLRAATLPFDGMNEHGLVVGMASSYATRAEARPDRQTVGSVGILRLLLDQARTVDEALVLFRRYNVDFEDGPPLHYFVADARGESTVIEFVAGATRVLPRERSWQLLVNFQLADSTVEQRAADRRYREGSARLDAAGGRLDWRATLALLRDLRQGHTQWSAAYEPTTGAVHLTTGQRYERVHEFRVPGR